jgi:regulator of sigma D
VQSKEAPDPKRSAKEHENGATNPKRTYWTRSKNMINGLGRKTNKQLDSDDILISSTNLSSIISIKEMIQRRFEIEDQVRSTITLE